MKKILAPLSLLVALPLHSALTPTSLSLGGDLRLGIHNYPMGVAARLVDETPGAYIYQADFTAEALIKGQVPAELQVDKVSRRAHLVVPIGRAAGDRHKVLVVDFLIPREFVSGDLQRADARILWTFPNQKAVPPLVQSGGHGEIEFLEEHF